MKALLDFENGPFDEREKAALAYAQQLTIDANRVDDALFARLRLVATDEYADLLDSHELEPSDVRDVVREKGSTLVIGAFAALASYALFHLITVFPLSWIRLYTQQSLSEFLMVQMIGAVLAAGGIVASGLIADRLGRRRTLGTFAVMIAVFSGFAPTLLDGGTLGQDVFILLGFILLGLSYGQAAGAVSSNFGSKYRYTGAAHRWSRWACRRTSGSATSASTCCRARPARWQH